MAVPAKLDPKALKPELADFREKTDAFYAGQMPKPEYKGFSGYFGSYAQRSGDASMLRLRMPAGRVTKQRLAFVAGALRSGVKRLHFTTCQTIQLHDLVPEQLYRLIEGALDVGIIPLGGGGDFPRNVMCSPLAGAAGRMRVLCVTWLTWLAAMAGVHFSVEKGERDGRTYTQVERLSRERRMEELARLTSGEHITDATLHAAGELLDGAEAYRKLHKS